MTATVEFKTPAAARYFCEAVLLHARRGKFQGRDLTDVQWAALAGRTVERLLGEPRRSWQEPAVEQIARIMRDYRRAQKRAGAVFRGVTCDCCGTLLTAPESVLAGRGPKCMEDGKQPAMAHQDTGQ